MRRILNWKAKGDTWFSLPCYQLTVLFDEVIPEADRTQWEPGTGSSYYTQLLNWNDKIERFVTVLKENVFLDDETDGAFAISMNQEVTQDENGNNQFAKTEVGRLEYRAKYKKDKGALEKLSDIVANYFTDNPMFFSIQAVCAVPSDYPLTKTVAWWLECLCGNEEVPNLSEYLIKVKSTHLKNLSLEEKLITLDGAYQADDSAFKDKNILLVDDLYQSGSTVNYIANLLREKGANKVFVFAVTKSLSNSDNKKKDEFKRRERGDITLDNKGDIGDKGLDKFFDNLDL